MKFPKQLKRRQLRALLLILFCLLLYTTWLVYAKSTEELSNEDFIRFHVIANSDTEEDQALKLKVRDQVLDKVNQDLLAQVMSSEQSVPTAAMSTKTTLTMDLDSTRTFILDHLDEIEAVAEACIAENGYDYSVDAQLGVRWIPQKTYGTVTFPAGNYEALNIVIGAGDGQNWWCVLFPPLCLIDGDPLDQASSRETLAGEEAYKDALMQEARLAEKYQPLLSSGTQATTLKLKFKTLELLKKK